MHVKNIVKQQEREAGALRGRLEQGLKEWERGEARRKKRERNRTTTHPKQRKAMATEALRALFERNGRG